MLELAIPFAGAAIFTVLLRRLDKSNLNLRKIKDVIERGKKELNQVTLSKKVELQDATHQFDVLLVNADKYVSSLKTELSTASDSLKNVEESKKNLLQMDAELKYLEDITNSIKGQMGFVHDSLDKIDHNKKKLKRIQDQLNSVEAESSQLLKGFQEATREKSIEMMTALEKKFEEISEQTITYHEELRSDILQKQNSLDHELKSNYNVIENSIKNSANELTGYLEDRMEGQASIINEFDTKIKSYEETLNQAIPAMVQDIKEELVSDLRGEQERLEVFQQNLNKAEDSFHKKLEVFRNELEKHKNGVYSQMMDEAEKIREQVQGLDYEAITKRDELIAATRKEASRITENIEEFQDMYLRAKEHIFLEASEKEQDIIAHLENLKKEGKMLLEDSQLKADNSIEKMNQSIIAMRKEGEAVSTLLKEESANRIDELARYSERFQNDTQEIKEEIEKTAKDYTIITNEIIEESLEKIKQKAQATFHSAHSEFASKADAVNRQLEDLRDEVSNAKQMQNDSEKEWESKSNEMEKKFNEKLSIRLEEVNGNIEHIETELRKLRSDASESLDSKMSRMYTKLGTIEKSMVDSQSHLMSTWQTETNNFNTLITEKESQFNQLSETIEFQVQSLVKEAESKLHRGSLDLEKKSQETVTQLDNLLDEKSNEIKTIAIEAVEENKRNLGDVVQEFKKKTQEKEDRLFDKYQEISIRFEESRIALEKKQDSMVNRLQEEKARIENEMFATTDRQLELFHANVNENIANKTNSIKELSENSLSEMKVYTREAIQDFMAVKEDASTSFDEFKLQQQEIVASIIDETKNAGYEVEMLQKALGDLKGEASLLERTENGIANIQKILNEFDIKLNLIKEKNGDLDAIFEKADSLKDLRVKFDAELASLKKKKNKVDAFEEQLEIVLNMRDEIEDKTENLKKVKDSIDEILVKYEDSMQAKEKLNNMMHDLLSQQELIESTVQKIVDQELNMNQIGEVSLDLNANLEQLATKSNRMQEKMVEIEGQMLMLQRSESEIQQLKERFMQIEDLAADIDNRKNQLEILGKRYEVMRSSMSNSVHEIEKLEHDADTKVKHLVQLVGAVNLPDKNTIKNSPLGVGDKNKLVKDLSNMGWTAEEISTRANLALGTVNTILSTYAR